jgi:single-stranded-DNA-specific exonuclease
MKLRVVRREVNEQQLKYFAHLPSVLARAYAARGIDDPQRLSSRLDRLLPVGTLEGVEAAVELLLSHRRSGGLILVVGDFDADGATSSALLVRALRSFGFARVDFLVPNRFEFGYGLTPGIVEVAAASEPSLIITVDNGISSLEGVARARALGIDVLVTDHHLAAAELPTANVIVNPNMPGVSFGSKSLAGVGVAFYVVAALHRVLREQGALPVDAPSPAQWLDLVALGTVADIVPLDDNNRILVAQGLARIRAGRGIPGIQALLELGNRSLPRVVAADLGFVVGPRINAAGRLDDMTIGIRCLLAESLAEAREIAAKLDALNRERRAIESDMQTQALAAIRHLVDPAEDGRYGLCLYDPSWHQGVVGLVAGRIKERVRRPVIAFADADEGELRGSARSVPGVHVRDAIESIASRHPQMVIRFGGHAMAAGLTLARDQLDAFAQLFDREVKRWQAGGSLADQIESDGALALEEFSLASAMALREAGPWGQGFAEPTFDQIFHLHSPKIVAERHLKVWLEPLESGRRFEAIAFNVLADPDSPLLEGGQLRLPERAHVVYRLDVNEYRGESRLQLLVDHLLDYAS